MIELVYLHLAIDISTVWMVYHWITMLLMVCLDFSFCYLFDENF